MNRRPEDLPHEPVSDEEQLARRARRAQWVAALRSGDYQQGTGCLRWRSDSEQTSFYCCLGVLTDLYIQAHPDEAYWQSADWDKEKTEYEAVAGGQVKQDVCPDAVREWVGLRSNFGHYQYQDGTYREKLTGLNDEKDYSFDQIADVIEHPPPGLFTTP